MARRRVRKPRRFSRAAAPRPPASPTAGGRRSRGRRRRSPRAGPRARRRRARRRTAASGRRWRFARRAGADQQGDSASAAKTSRCITRPSRTSAGAACCAGLLWRKTPRAAARPARRLQRPRPATAACPASSDLTTSAASNTAGMPPSARPRTMRRSMRSDLTKRTLEIGIRNAHEPIMIGNAAAGLRPSRLSSTSDGA